ncbi:hypothetical protein AX15_001554 [Amanita polypyramis BW_CC]|nr:hypothetical protein AX15_001554 [Amanita polypyramis BW_CC]
MMEASGYQRSISFKSQNDDVSVDPDELFTKYTIPEVKVVQQKLRAEADQKKQELRLMVGERYRDILQASTSIISIFESSQRVLDALDESKAAILRQQDPPVLKGLPSQKDTDTHLHTLQQLAAHIKLLIDAPENLWRLIERKKYFPATWLFLLVRVVHRALIRDNEDEEGIWRCQGVDVLSEFPLIQRQWDVVSQFRSQIIHKAILSLRDFELSSEDACAALVTLHLLDSRPLTEAFLAFLNQRMKTLVSSLSHQFHKQDQSTVLANGHAHAHFISDSTSFIIPSHTTLAQEVREAMQIVLSIMVHTMKLTRDIFDCEGWEGSMMYNVLKSMQPDSVESTPPGSLSPELHLTTPSVLSTLPSPIQLQLLPPDLKTYKPYVELNSASSAVSQNHISSKLGEWLTSSISIMAKSFQPWLDHLQTVKEVWNVRTSTWKWISSSQIRTEEKSLISNTLDDIFSQRIVGLWRVVLQNAQDQFSKQLESALVSTRNPKNNSHTDFPVDNLYFPPPMPQHSQLGLGSKINPFEKHYSALRKRLARRTRLLDDVIATLESCARSIQGDISSMSGGTTDNKDLVEHLIVGYRPFGQRLCHAVVDILDESERSLPDNSSDELAFLYTIMDELASSSCFITLIGCPPDIAQECRRRLERLYDKTLDRWRECIATTTKQHGASAALIRSLITLSKSTLQSGLPRDFVKRKLVVRGTLKSFASQYLAQSGHHAISDLAVLQQIVKRYGKDCRDIQEELAKRLEEHTVKDPDIEKAAVNVLARCQNLLAPLLSYDIPDRPPDDKQGFLLPIGIPVSDTRYQSATSIAKPGSRFGLLLVEGSVEF